jgi:alpha-D-ribose 1-methylphosphonate 5-triphosphate synthase subunit PhnG
MTDLTSPLHTSGDPAATGTGARQQLMATLAASSPEALAERFESLPQQTYELVRQPETGLVMVRGRMGGTGSPFNLGEVTVTRCVVRLESGETGSGYSLGRNKQKALQSALIDALWQQPEMKARIEAEVIAPLSEAQQAARETVREETEATKVNFFTMVRGDN